MGNNQNYGMGGRATPIEPGKIPFDLSRTGLNGEDSPKRLEMGEMVDMNHLMWGAGGISTDFLFDDFPNNGGQGQVPIGDPILHLTSLEKKDSTKLVVRMKYNKWQWFNGASWVDVVGTPAGVVNQRMYSLVMDDKLIVANGATRLAAWDGNPVNAVADLSAEAPAAKFAIRVGNRILAANLKFVLANDLNPFEVSWSADNNIGEWTDVSAGAGDAIIQPEGTSIVPNFITGLSTLERGTIMYRQRAIVSIARTGTRIAPFRFTTIDFTHGTESPYAIVNGGPKIGDFFLGYDCVMYHFDGNSEPIPIGLPIQRRLESRITDLSECISFINPKTMELWLLSPTSIYAKPKLADIHIFSIRDYIRKQKLSWRYISLPDIVPVPITSAGYARAATKIVPFVDSFTDTKADKVDPTDPPVFKASAIYIPPVVIPPGDINYRTTFMSYGLYTTDPTKLGFQTNGDPYYLTPDTVHADSSGSHVVGTLIPACRTRKARFCLRITGGSNTNTMVNYPTNRAFDISKWKGFVLAFYNEVRAVSGGEALLRGMVRDRLCDGIMAFDDISVSGTTANAFNPAPNFEVVEDCCAYFKSLWPWMPLVCRVPAHWMKSKAAAASSTSQGSGAFSNEGSRDTHGVRQYKYLDAAWSQYRPKFANQDGVASAYPAFENDAAAACSLANWGGFNLSDMGAGTSPNWGCVHGSTSRLDACSMSPAEITAIGNAFLADSRTKGLVAYSYAVSTAYYDLTAVSAALADLRDLAINREEANSNVRGNQANWWGDLTTP